MSVELLRGPRILTRLSEIKAVRKNVDPGLYKNLHPDRELNMYPRPNVLPEGNRTPEAYLTFANWLAENCGDDYAARALRNGRLKRPEQRKIMTVALKTSIRWDLVAIERYDDNRSMDRANSISKRVEADRRLLEKTAHPGSLARFLDKIF